MVNHILHDLTSNYHPLNLKRQEESEANAFNKAYYKQLIRPVDQIIKENFILKKGQNSPFQVLISKIEEEEGNLSEDDQEDNLHSPENKMI